MDGIEIIFGFKLLATPFWKAESSIVNHLNKCLSGSWEGQLVRSGSTFYEFFFFRPRETTAVCDVAPQPAAASRGHRHRRILMAPQPCNQPWLPRHHPFRPPGADEVAKGIELGQDSHPIIVIGLSPCGYSANPKSRLLCKWEGT